MGRLAVILGSSAVGPGGGGIAAAAESHGATVLQRHAAPDGEYRLPHLIDHARQPALACSRRAATGRWRSARSAR